jgi:hypothetical protein
VVARTTGEHVDVPAACGETIGHLAHEHLRATDQVVAEPDGHETDSTLTSSGRHATA